jgi:thiamine-phosphate pyrophosphorylase
MSTNEFIKLSKEIKIICKKYNVPLIINDNIQVMLESDADGIHVGQEDDFINIRKKIGENKIFGLTVSSKEEIDIAIKNDVDYLGFFYF